MWWEITRTYPKPGGLPKKRQPGLSFYSGGPEGEFSRCHGVACANGDPIWRISKNSWGKGGKKGPNESCGKTSGKQTGLTLKGAREGKLGRENTATI